MREALYSEQNINILWRACQAQHLSEDKIESVATLVGDVIYGFTHPYDLAREIRNELGLNPTIAEEIASEVDRKIFSLIRPDLEKVYSPVGETKAFPGNAEVLDLRKKYETEVAKNPEIGGNIEIKGEPAPIPEIVITENKTETNRNQGTEEIKTEIAPTETGPKILPLEENKPKEVEPKKFESEGPLIIHKETEIKPLTETKKSLGGFFGFLKKEKPEEIRPNPVRAEVRIDHMKIPFKQEAAVMPELTITETAPKIETPAKAEIPPKTEPVKPRVVHYSQFSTPIKTEIPLKSIETKEVEIPPKSIEPKKIEPLKTEPPKPKSHFWQIFKPKPKEVKTEIKPPIPPAPKIPSAPVEKLTEKSRIPFSDFRKIEKPPVPPPSPSPAPAPMPTSIPKPPVEPPNPNPSKPDEDMIDLNIFK